jgi:hypothetical protein
MTTARSSPDARSSDDPLTRLIERARREILLARVVGKYTVDLGLGALRRRLIEHVDPITSSAGGATVEVLADAVEDEVVAPVSTTAAADLVLPDYDHLPAAHIVAKLGSLTQRERDAVEEYEAANRHRRTILGKLDQLRECR